MTKGKQPKKVKLRKASKALQVDPCQVCFERPRAKGVYRKIEGKSVLLYEACKECHARVVQATRDFDHPEWERIQRELEKEHKG